MLVCSLSKELLEMLQNTVLFMQILGNVLMRVLLFQCLVDTCDLVVGVEEYALVIEDYACGLV
jgi:hypothetical protein